VQKYGTIEKFDLLFHRSGPSAGQPRGYAFVTYSSKADATNAKDALDGMVMGCKKVVVRWANSVSKVFIRKLKCSPVTIKIQKPALCLK
jgi:RNA recognition motif-containing protein